jgi:hypothetical protein
MAKKMKISKSGKKKSKLRSGKLPLPMSQEQYCILENKALELGYEEIEKFLIDKLFKGLIPGTGKAAAKK